MSDNSNSSVNPEMLKSLLDMGILEDVARKALILTNSSSLEQAISLALELSDGDTEPLIKYKMVFVVNASLHYGPSDLASMVAGSSIRLYHEVLASHEGMMKIAAWREHGEKNLILQGENNELQNVHMQAINRELPFIIEKPSEILSLVGFFGEETEIEAMIKKLKPI